MQLDGLLDILRRTGAYRGLLDGLAQGSPLPDQHILRSARPFVLAALASDLDRPLLIIAGRVDRAHNIAEQLPVWLPGRAIERFAEPTSIFYERSPWTPSAIQNRLTTLASLAPPVGVKRPASEPPPIIVSSALALMQKTLPAREFRAASRLLRVGTQISPESLLHTWLENGYEPASIVIEPGTFSRRGGILDIFPVSARQPVRIEFFGDEIDSLRTFDAASQRSLASIEQIAIPPAREALPRFGPAAAEKLADWFSRRPDPTDDVTSSLPDFEPLSNGVPFAHLEYYLPYFHSQPATLLDYLPENGLIVVDDWGALHDSMGDLEEQAVSLRREKTASDHLPVDYPLPYLTWDELQDELSARATLRLGTNPEMPLTGGVTLGDLFAPGQRYGGQLRYVLDELHRLVNQAERVIVVSQQAQRLAELWSEQNGYIPPVSQIPSADALGDLTFVEGTLAEGWTLTGERGRDHLLTDAELFGWQRPEPRRHIQRRAVPPEATFADLQVGDYVVHVEYGIGRFAGLQKRVIDESEREYLIIEYAGNDLLYVPIHQADRLSRYVGADDRVPPLNRLGTQEWARTKENTRRAVEEVARELLELYAARASVVGHAFSPDTPWQAELEASFPYVETDDQLLALRAVKQDMESPHPMDRLICGDVGYGKTEVALRAAFKAVMDGKQVAILVPTTVLAQQHFNTFARRLVSFPVKVEMLSRFRSPAEQREILSGLARGTVDIVIGTHRLLQADVAFHDLGLLIIDEEQRFGVTHKEQLKRFRTEVDVLTLTATPIPRTLAMSLEGIRDFSVIATAPQKRLAIKTFVRRESDSAIREALLRELKRGGQAYFLHNEVETIANRRTRLAELVPEARIAVAHGQMPERELERVMRDFHQQRFNVLLCTTIIETGIDVPTANTIVIHRADRFGLAQLHQLRGRVGRSHHQAYAYLLIPDEAAITRDAGKRLEAIQAMEELGSGFYLAMHDLEIRGAGEVLGESQSGDMQEVGFALYTDMLDEAVRSLKAGREPDLSAPLAATTEIKLHVPALLPTDYCPDVHERLTLYKRMANCSTADTLDALREELVDRFGKLPEAARALVETHRLRIDSQPLGIARIDAASEAIVVQFVPNPPIDPAAIIRFIQSRRDVKLAGPDRLRFTLSTPDLAARLQRIREILAGLVDKAPKR